jgi:hypothetical protein
VAGLPLIIIRAVPALEPAAAHAGVQAPLAAVIPPAEIEVVLAQAPQTLRPDSNLRASFHESVTALLLTFHVFSNAVDTSYSP